MDDTERAPDGTYRQIDSPDAATSLEDINNTLREIQEHQEAHLGPVRAALERIATSLEQLTEQLERSPLLVTTRHEPQELAKTPVEHILDGTHKETEETEK